MNGVQIFSIILGFAGLAGGATGYFAKSRGDTIISLQGKEIAYWKDKATELEKVNTALAAERDTLKRENNKLWSKAQGSTQLTKLTKEIANLVQLYGKKS
jgi:FtsZ-binding cell division protein ZapB